MCNIFFGTISVYLAKQAFVDRLNEEEVAEISVNAFINGLRDRRLQEKIGRKMPKTLEDAHKLATEERRVREHLTLYKDNSTAPEPMDCSAITKDTLEKRLDKVTETLADVCHILMANSKQPQQQQQRQQGRPGHQGPPHFQVQPQVNQRYRQPPHGRPPPQFQGRHNPQPKFGQPPHRTNGNAIRITAGRRTTSRSATIAVTSVMSRGRAVSVRLP